MPKRYRLKLVDVEAIELTPENLDRAVLWCNGRAIEEIDVEDSKKRFVGINIPTLEGVLRASETDYIVKNLRGGFTVMSKYEFESKYEMV